MEQEKIAITTPFIKLGSLLKLAGVVDTGGVGNLVIADGLVSVNGEVCLQRGKKIVPGDIVVIADDEDTLTLEVIHADNGN